MEWIFVFGPVVAALVMILWTRNAALSLLVACLLAALSIAGGNPLEGVKLLLVEHALPALSGSWHIGPILFTLLLGSFAQLLESSGGLQRLMSDRMKSDRTTMFGVFTMGILCFFDGLANAMLVGRVARPVIDRQGIPRQVLAYVVDSTSSSVACVAFISTWIATQLSLIQMGLEGSGVETSPVMLFFSSIPANPYCWLALLMVALVIWRRWWIGPMASYHQQYSRPEESVEDVRDGKASSFVVPLLVLLVAVPAAIYGFQEGDDWSWSNAFQGSHVPEAMVLAGAIALLAAVVCFPRQRWSEVGGCITKGASAMLGPLLILWLAWTFGSELKQLQVGQKMARGMSGLVTLAWLPLGVFVLCALISFFTGSSWGTMSICMPLMLGMAVDMVGQTEELVNYLPAVIGAVFGGAVFGDHCSPFSDTTVVSSMSAGCSMTSHVSTQLPYALICAVISAIGYSLMAVGIGTLIALFISCFLLILLVICLSRKSGAASEPAV